MTFEIIVCLDCIDNSKFVLNGELTLYEYRFIDIKIGGDGCVACNGQIGSYVRISFNSQFFCWVICIDTYVSTILDNKCSCIIVIEMCYVGIS